MRTFVITFALPALGAGLIYVLTDQLHVPQQYRIPVVLALTVVAFLTALLIEEKRDVVEHERLRSRIFALSSLLLSVAGILLLSHYRNNPTAAAAISPHPVSVRDEERKPQTPEDHLAATSSAPAEEKSDHMARRERGWLDSIDATPRLTRSTPAWVIVMYNDDGADFPILRATSQQILSANGISLASIVRNPAPVKTNSELFTATTGTLQKLTPYCDGLLVGKVRAQTVPSEQFEGMYKTHLSADVKVISASRGLRREFVIEEDGGGFDTNISQSNAERRLAEKLKSELPSLTFAQ